MPVNGLQRGMAGVRVPLGIPKGFVGRLQRTRRATNFNVDQVSTKMTLDLRIKSCLTQQSNATITEAVIEIMSSFYSIMPPKNAFDSKIECRYHRSIH